MTNHICQYNAAEYFIDDMGVCFRCTICGSALFYDGSYKEAMRELFNIYDSEEYELDEGE